MGEAPPVTRATIPPMTRSASTAAAGTRYLGRAERAGEPAGPANPPGPEGRTSGVMAGIPPAGWLLGKAPDAEHWTARLSGTSSVGTATSTKAPEPVALAEYRLKAARTGIACPKSLLSLARTADTDWRSCSSVVSAGRLTDRIEVICWLSDDVAARSWSMAARRCWSTDSTRLLWPKRSKSWWLRCERTPLSAAPCGDDGGEGRFPRCRSPARCRPDPGRRWSSR